MSYIGLFSYYNFDNWTYQPSYVSSNTPWFFNGVRIQWFPTDKLKIEPWIINGWQSYAKFNGHPGLGGQIKWIPKEWLSFVFNNYGMGTDELGIPGRSRIHTDDSVEVRYFNQPGKPGVGQDGLHCYGRPGMRIRRIGARNMTSCHNNKNGHPKQSFAGWMLYDRIWFHKDLFAMTIGGGAHGQSGTLSDACSRRSTEQPPFPDRPYFPEAPGQPYKAWDSTITFDYMPSQFITFRFETGYRYASVPYFSGRGGITPPGGNVAPVANNGSVGTAASYICTNGTTSAVSSFSPSGTVSPWTIWAVRWQPPARRNSAALGPPGSPIFARASGPTPSRSWSSSNLSGRHPSQGVVFVNAHNRGGAGSVPAPLPT